MWCVPGAPFEETGPHVNLSRDEDQGEDDFHELFAQD